MTQKRVKLTLDPEYAEKLSRIAKRAEGPEDEIASLLLCSAIDQAELDGELLTEILDGIPGAWERAQESLKQAKQGKTVPLSDL